MAALERAKGRCTECGRIISGRATGIEADHGDRRFVDLRPHNRQERARHPVVCLARGGRRVVPRIRG
jgi:hypothetical protein